MGVSYPRDIHDHSISGELSSFEQPVESDLLLSKEKESAGSGSSKKDGVKASSLVSVRVIVIALLVIAAAPHD
eukprot:g9141.t1